jgi:hypothetical protein
MTAAAQAESLRPGAPRRAYRGNGPRSTNTSCTRASTTSACRRCPGSANHRRLQTARASPESAPAPKESFWQKRTVYTVLDQAALQYPCADRGDTHALSKSRIVETGSVCNCDESPERSSQSLVMPPSIASRTAGIHGRDRLHASDHLMDDGRHQPRKSGGELLFTGWRILLIHTDVAQHPAMVLSRAERHQVGIVRCHHAQKQDFPPPLGVPVFLLASARAVHGQAVDGFILRRLQP